MREPQANASEAFTQFGEAHREVEKFAIKMLQTVKPVSTEPMVHDVSPSSYFMSCKTVYNINS